MIETKNTHGVELHNTVQYKKQMGLYYVIYVRGDLITIRKSETVRGGIEYITLDVPVSDLRVINWR